MSIKRLYSQSTGTTYIKGIHQEIPSDCVEISEKTFLDVIINRPAGKSIGHDGNGLPILVDSQKPNPSVIERQWRDAELASVMWLRERHRDQLEIEVEASLSGEQFTELLVYMQALRDWPQSEQFPDSEHRPVQPAWIADQTE